MPVGVIGAGLVAQAVHLPLLQRLGERFRGRGARRARTHSGPADGRARATAIACDVRGSPVAARGGRRRGRARVLAERHARAGRGRRARGRRARARREAAVRHPRGGRLDPRRARPRRAGRAGRLHEAIRSRRRGAARRAAAGTGSPCTSRRRRSIPGMREAFGMPAGDGGRRASGDAFLGALIHDVNLVQRRARARAGRRSPASPTRSATAPARAATIALGERRALDGRLARRCPEPARSASASPSMRHDGVRELEFPAPYALHEPTIYRHVRDGGGGPIATTRTSWREAYERQLEHFHARHRRRGARAARPPRKGSPTSGCWASCSPRAAEGRGVSGRRS